MLDFTEEQKSAYIQTLSNGIQLSSSGTKALTLSFNNGETLTNNDIVQESLSIKKAFCEEKTFHIGNVGATEFSIGIINKGVSFKDTECDVILTCNEVQVSLGHFIITDDTLSDNRIRRTLRGYDKAYTIRNANITEWYNDLYSVVGQRFTVKQIRDSFFEHFSVSQENTTLPNDNLLIPKTIDGSSTITGATILNAICEINGVFGSFNGNGVFTYKNIGRNSQTAHNGIILGGTAKKSPLVYKDYVVQPANKVQIRSDEEDLGGIYGTGTNTYVVSGNPLAYSLSATDLNTAAHNIYNIVSKVSYTPMKVTVPYMPWYELGDWIRYDITTSQNENVTIYAPILELEVSGIQASSMTIQANGTKEYPVKTEGTNEKIIALRKKSVQITQEIGEITERLDEQGIYPLFYPALPTNNNVKYPNTHLYPTTDLEYHVSTLIQQQIADAEGSILLQVDNKLTNYDTHEASLQLWVGRDDDSQVVSMINGSADVIELNADRFILNSTNLKISQDGTIEATNGIFSGELNSDEGTIGGWEIGAEGLYNDTSKFGIINFANTSLMYAGMTYEECIEYYEDPAAPPKGLYIDSSGMIKGNGLTIESESYGATTGISVSPENQAINIYSSGGITFRGSCVWGPGYSHLPSIMSIDDTNREVMIDKAQIANLSVINLSYGQFHGWTGTVPIGSYTMHFKSGILTSVT